MFNTSTRLSESPAYTCTFTHPSCSSHSPATGTHSPATGVHSPATGVHSPATGKCSSGSGATREFPGYSALAMHGAFSGRGVSCGCILAGERLCS